jgi:hypothetical protein
MGLLRKWLIHATSRFLASGFNAERPPIFPLLAARSLPCTNQLSVKYDRITICALRLHRYHAPNVENPGRQHDLGCTPVWGGDQIEYLHTPHNPLSQ